MKGYVITIGGHADSEAAAARCIESADAFGLTVMTWPASTPQTVEGTFASCRWPDAAFRTNRYSRPLPCMACFASHARLWGLCVALGQSFLILEHDAVFTAPLPDLGRVNGACNIARPSFGRFKQPPCGIGPLVSGPHFKGATAYYVTPLAAEQFLRKAKTEAQPTDVFLSLARFPFLQEAFPWSVECREEVSTIQREEGCRAKHRKVRIV